VPVSSFHIFLTRFAPFFALTSFVYPATKVQPCFSANSQSYKSWLNGSWILNSGSWVINSESLVSIIISSVCYSCKYFHHCLPRLWLNNLGK
jgi:hypothetical protein